MPDTPGTLNFPTSLDTAVSLFEVLNRAYTTMTGSIGTGDLSIGVANGSLLPSTGAVTLVDSLSAPTKVEHVIYTVNSSNTLTVPAGGRGFGGSTAQTWSGTVYVRARALAQHHSVLRGGIIALETKLGINSSTPSSGTILRGTGAGASDWGALVNADVSASAAIALSKLAALTASRAVITDVSGVLSAATTTATEIGYVNGVTSAIQTQIDGKQASDADLTAIAGLSPSNDDVIQRKAGAWTNRTPTQLTADLIAFTGDSGSGGVKGLVPAPSAGDAAASKYLKADGTWATVSAGGGITIGTTTITGGTAPRVLYNNAGVVGEYAITGTGNAVLSASPTLTGTVAVAAAAFSGQVVSSLNGAASTPPLTMTGTWFTGGSSTTTKPQLLIEPTGATSTGWSTSGTGLGVNSASGFTGNLIDLQVNGSSRFLVSNSAVTITPDMSVGKITASNFINALGSIFLNSSSNIQFNADTYIRRAAAAVISVEGTSSVGGAIASPARTPSQITSDQNNYSPGSGLNQRWSSDASRNITGMAAGQAGEFRYIWNVGSNNIVLQNENASSTAANRFTTTTGADLTLAANGCAYVQYDATSSRWRAALL